MTITDPLITSPDAALRRQAIRSLAAGCPPSAIPALSVAVNDPDAEVRELAIRSLAEYPPSLALPRLEEFLRNGDEPNLRTAALEIIPVYGEASQDFLFRLLGDADPEIRMFAAQLLAGSGSPAAVDRLVGLLDDPDPNVVHHAVEALGAIADPRSAGTLIGLLSRDFWICYPALVALGEIGSSEAVEPLLRLLDDEALAPPAIEALGRIGDAAAIPALAAVISSGRADFRNEVIAALVRIQCRVERHIVPDRQCLPSIRRALDQNDLLDHLLRSLSSEDLEVQKNAIIALGWLKPAAAAADLTRLLGDYDLEEYVAGSLAAIGSAAVPELRRALENPDPRVRLSAVRCLGWVEDPEGPLACLAGLADGNLEVRGQAVVSLAAVVELEPAEDALLAALADPEPELVAATVDVLGHSRSARLPGRLAAMMESTDRAAVIGALRVQARLRAGGMVPAIERLRPSPDPEIRARACDALAGCPETRLSIPALVNAAHDPNPLVRRSAAAALGGGPREEVEHHLLALLKDPADEVRRAALDSLGRVGSSTSVEFLIQAFPSGTRQFQLSVIETLGGIHGPETRTFLAGILQVSSPDLKCAAIESLARLGDRRATPHLVVALDDRDWSVRHATVRALGRIGDRRSALHLVDKLSDPEEIVRKEAVTALGRMGARETVNHLLPLLRSPYLQPEAFDAIIRLGISDLQSFSRFFREADAGARGTLVELAAELHDPRLADFLAEAATDETPSVRVRAARALGRGSVAGAAEVLVRRQREDSSEDVRREAAAALRRLDNR